MSISFSPATSAYGLQKPFKTTPLGYGQKAITPSVRPVALANQPKPSFGAGMIIPEQYLYIAHRLIMHRVPGNFDIVSEQCYADGTKPSIFNNWITNPNRKRGEKPKFYRIELGKLIDPTSLYKICQEPVYFEDDDGKTHSVLLKIERYI